jgi:hypothetical protein
MSLKTIAPSWHKAHRNGVNVPGLLGGGWLSQEGKTMESYFEQYEAREGGVTLHT